MLDPTTRILIVPTLIGLLLFPCSPFAIIGRIWSVIVDAFQGVFGASFTPSRWSFPHIRKEVRETMPSLAYGYPTATIVSKFWSTWIEAALHHVRPQHIFRKRRNFFSMALSHEIDRQAAAAIDMTAKIGGTYNFLPPAPTYAFPKPTLYAAYCGQAPELMARKIDFTHNGVF